MTVYVDPAVHRFGRMTMAHMWADTLDELHTMAVRLGLRCEWFQHPPRASWHHYDVSKGKRDAAIRFGAVATDNLGPIEFLARRNGDAEKLASVERVRARRAVERAEGLLL